MNNENFNNLLESVRQDAAPAEAERGAASRVYARLEEAAATAGGACSGFRSQFEAYRQGTIGEARRMLLEDHLHSCVACRTDYHGERKAEVISIAAQRPAMQRYGRRAMPWAIAAAAAAVLVVSTPSILDRTFAPSGARATVASVDGALYRVSARGEEALQPGAAIAENEELRTAKGSRAIVALPDGSRVEIGERSEVRLTERWSGKTVHLAHGAVMVEAAKQRRGRLEVATPDCLVSVKGTIFGVAFGLKGSRVSVVEGEVKVDQDSASRLLHRGDQTTTHPSMAETSVADDIRWSENSPKYLALLSELTAIEKRIEALPAPALRYSSKLAGLLPENTAIFVAIPNLGPTLAEANKIIEERVRENATLRQWWNEQEATRLREVLDHVRGISEFLGDEVVLGIPSNSGAPLIVAEARRPGLQAFLDAQHIAMDVGPMRALVHGNIVAVGAVGAVTQTLAHADAGGQSGFLATPLWARISQSYQSGAGWIFAADMEQISGKHVSDSNVTSTAKLNPASVTGVDNLRFLVVERKDNLGRTENRAALSFAGPRRGIASWLAAPGTMGSLEFTSPQASFAGSFVIKNPGTLLDELLGMAGAQAGLAADMAKFQQETGVNLHDDIAASLGGEMTVSVDGPLLPTPSWKVAIEVYSPTRLQWAIEQLVNTARRDAPQTSVTLASQQVNGLTYYTLSTPQLPVEVDYVFTDGYLVAAASRELLTLAIQTKASGLTLSRSAGFRAQLPQDGYSNFSALLYYNVAPVLGPMVDQMKSTGLVPADTQKALEALTADRTPSLIYAYGETDQIVVATRSSGFFGLGLDTLVGLNGKGAGMFPQLLSPMLQMGRGNRKASEPPQRQ